MYRERLGAENYSISLLLDMTFIDNENIKYLKIEKLRFHICTRVKADIF